MSRVALALFALPLLAAPAAAQPRPVDTLRDSVEVLDELDRIKLQGIPPRLLRDAHAVAVIPRVMKAGFMIGGRVGFGVLLTRGEDKNWGEPTFLRLGGASFGFQAGVQAADVVLVFRNKDSVDRLLRGRGKLTLGADAAVAAGPVGRQAVAGTDARLSAEILSYSRARGLFAGVSLGGAVVQPAPEMNREYRGRADRPDAQKAVADLKAKLQDLARN
ncbi:MAG: lipid-binding SYLF domain-containing protein [Gemmataceae bacterium]